MGHMIFSPNIWAFSDNGKDLIRKEDFHFSTQVFHDFLAHLCAMKAVKRVVIRGDHKLLIWGLPFIKQWTFFQRLCLQKHKKNSNSLHQESLSPASGFGPPFSLLPQLATWKGGFDANLNFIQKQI